jgi:hypothetical protein
MNVFQRIKAPVSRLWWHVRGAGLTFAGFSGSMLAIKTEYNIEWISGDVMQNLLIGGTIITFIAQLTVKPDYKKQPKSPNTN